MDIEIIRGTESDVDAVAPLWHGMVEHHRAVVAGQVPVRPADDSWQRRRREYLSWLADGTGLLFLARRGGGGAVPGQAVPGDAAPGHEVLGHEVLGYAFCRLVPSGPTFDLGEVRGDVESLAVSPRERGGGVGTALLEAVRADLEQRGCSHWSISVAAANTGAVQLYERLGFRPWVQHLAAPLAP